MKTPFRKTLEVSKKRFVLERGPHLPPLPLSLIIPKEPVRISDILPILFHIADKAFDLTIREHADKGLHMACGPGCGHCCKQLVPVSDHEAFHLARVVREMPEPQRRQTEARFEAELDKLRSAGILEELLDFFRNRVHNAAEYRKWQKQYWELGISCPFLVDESCSIHKQRPITCRQYSVTGSPENCRFVFSSDHVVDEIHQPVDLGGTLAAFTGAGTRASRVVPIIFALMAEEELEEQDLPELPAENMIGRFLDFASMCYCDKA